MATLFVLLSLAVISTAQDGGRVTATAEEIAQCPLTAEIMILMDASGSIGNFGFETEKQFVCDFIVGLPISETDVRVGVVRYATTANVVIALSDHSELAPLQTAIMNIAYTGGGTNTAAAITTGHTHLTNFGRSDEAVHKIIVLITDGVANNPTTALAAANSALADEVIIFAVGAGGFLDLERLLDYTGNDPTRRLTVESVNLLSTLVQELHTDLCNVGVGTVGGDPHFRSFDNLLHHYQGLSGVWYTAVRVAPAKGGKTMKIEIQTQDCGGSFQCLDAVRMLLDDVVVSHINTHGPVKQRVKDGHGGIILTNTTNEYYTLSFQANNITHIKARNGVKYWVRGMWMKVEVPALLKGRVTGLLGTFNGDHTDDLTAQHGEIIAFDKHAVEQFVDAKASMPVQEFGHSWISRNMTGGLGHKFGTQSFQESLQGPVIVNYTSGDVSNSIKDRCQQIVMSALKLKCGSVPWEDAQKLITSCQYDLNVCPDCVDMIVDGAELHCH